MKVLKKSNSFDGFQHKFNVTNDPPGFDRTTVVHDEDFVPTSKEEKSEDEEEEDSYSYLPVFIVVPRKIRTCS